MRLLVFLLLIAGCAPSCARRYDARFPEPRAPLPLTIGLKPPEIYRTWWRKMERCTGRRGRFEDWTFELYPHRYLFPQSWDSLGRVATVTIAQTSYELHSIILSQDAVLDSLDVQHEMIHALGQRSHSYRVFVTKCRVETDSTMRYQDNPIGMP